MTAPRIWSDPRALRVLGSGAALPGPPVPTEALLELVERRFGVEVRARGEAYAGKLGVKSRHVARDFRERREGPRAGDSNPQLAARAVRAALEDAGLRLKDLSYLIGHTATPALPIPSNVSLVADLLGYEGPHMELRQACTGFANAAVIAQGLLATPGCRAVAIVGSEAGSVHLDPIAAAGDAGQLVNLVMMGDAAAAVVLGRAEPGETAGTLANVYLGQIGGGKTPGMSRRTGGSAQPWSEDHVLGFTHDFEHVRTTGPELFLRGAAALTELGSDPTQADIILPHQASGRIGREFNRHFGVALDRVFINADRVGNTGSAAIWLGLHELRQSLPAGGTVAVLGAEATKHLFGGFAYAHG